MVTVKVAESVMEHYNFLLQYKWGKRNLVWNARLMYRLVPPQGRPGYQPILPGQCVAVPIDMKRERQSERFLINLPADKRVSIKLGLYNALNHQGLLSWKLYSGKALESSGELDDSRHGRLQDGITLEEGTHVLVVERNGMPGSLASSAAGDPEHAGPPIAYGLLVTWGEMGGEGCFPPATQGLSYCPPPLGTQSVSP